MIEETRDLGPQLAEVTRSRFASLPPSVRSELVGGQLRVSVRNIVLTESSLLVVLYSALRARQIEKHIDAYGEPFPGLFTTKKDSFSIAVNIDGAQRSFFRSVQFGRFDFCFFLGNDSSVIIEDLRYVPAALERKITVPLAYAVSFGQEINLLNCVEYFEDLLVYHLHHFRSLRHERANVS